MTWHMLELLRISTGLGTFWDPPGGAAKRSWGDGCLDYFAERAATADGRQVHNKVPNDVIACAKHDQLGNLILSDVYIF